MGALPRDSIDHNGEQDKRTQPAGRGFNSGENAIADDDVFWPCFHS